VRGVLGHEALTVLVEEAVRQVRAGERSRDQRPEVRR
jgi:hypothetical protein